MGRSQIVAVTFCSLTCLGYANMSAHAGWFGPSNYQECLLEEMRGQSPYMLPSAAAVCNRKFPPPPPKPPEPEEVLLGENNESDVKYNLCSGDNQDETRICIIENPRNYKITKVIGHFSIKVPCTFVRYPRIPSLGLQFQYNYSQLLSEYDENVRMYRADQETFTNIIGTQSFFSQTYSFSIKGNYNCSYVSIYGFVE